MDAKHYWSVERCGWEPADAAAEPYWSVERCRWEPPGPITDALPTPWSMFAQRDSTASPAAAEA